MCDSGSESGWSKVGSAQRPRSASAPPPSKYGAADGPAFVRKNKVIVGPLPSAPSGAGYRYYVPGRHLVERPTVWCGKLLTGRLTGGWSTPPNLTGFAELEDACNAALSLFRLVDDSDSLDIVVRVQ